jgi:uncharacterized membrane protein YfcA
MRREKVPVFFSIDFWLAGNLDVVPGLAPGQNHGMNFWIASIIGLASGVASGLFGVGGGIVMVPAMVYFLSPPIRDIKQAIGTSLVVIIPTAIMGSFKHYHHGNIEWRTVAGLVPLALAGSYLGAWLTTQISADGLKRAFGAFIIVVGVKLLFFK